MVETRPPTPDLTRRRVLDGAAAAVLASPAILHAKRSRAAGKPIRTTELETVLGPASRNVAETPVTAGRWR